MRISIPLSLYHGCMHVLYYVCRESAAGIRIVGAPRAGTTRALISTIV